MASTGRRLAAPALTAATLAGLRRTAPLLTAAASAATTAAAPPTAGAAATATRCGPRRRPSPDPGRSPRRRPGRDRRRRRAARPRGAGRVSPIWGRFTRRRARRPPGPSGRPCDAFSGMLVGCAGVAVGAARRALVVATVTGAGRTGCGCGRRASHGDASDGAAPSAAVARAARRQPRSAPPLGGALLVRLAAEASSSEARWTGPVDRGRSWRSAAGAAGAAGRRRGRGWGCAESGRDGSPACPGGR